MPLQICGRNRTDHAIFAFSSIAWQETKPSYDKWSLEPWINYDSDITAEVTVLEGGYNCNIFITLFVAIFLNHGSQMKNRWQTLNKIIMSSLIIFHLGTYSIWILTWHNQPIHDNQQINVLHSLPLSAFCYVITINCTMQYEIPWLYCRDMEKYFLSII